MYQLTTNQLLFDLHCALFCACKNKLKKEYVLRFKENEHENLVKLRDELISRIYQPGESVCFIVTYPKPREVFAANFEDRIIHHLYFNYTYQLFKNTFIEDNYSCIKGRGTHYGIERLKVHILQESQNYSKECYCLKMDIKGYFMHINRNRLNEIALESLDKMSTHRVDNKSDKTWNDAIDMDFIKWLTSTIALFNPILNCRFRSKPSAWKNLPKSRSLFYVTEGCGLPIGNLTSQLFSNVYLNKLDQFVKRELKCKHYGRYVDDFYLVSCDKDFLRSAAKSIEQFLAEELFLNINQGKTIISNVKHGVNFLGSFIKEGRTYISNESLNRIKNRLNWVDYNDWSLENTEAVLNSYLGIFSHYNSYNIRKELFDKLSFLKRYGVVNFNYTKFLPYNKIL